MRSPQRLRGVVQHYAWGGNAYLPQLLGLENPEQRPFAEYWLGVHPKGMAQLPERGNIPLATWLAEDSAHRLGRVVAREFTDLPFLLKILDVRQMLSIQLHPPKAAAKKGFAREEAAGIAHDAPNRNYRDRNHKPELMVALTDFWLLHGFRTPDAIATTLSSVPTWNSLQKLLADLGVAGLYRHVMTLPQPEVDILLAPLRAALEAKADSLSRDQADYWAWQAFRQYSRDGQHDRGIFSIYWFNLVHLQAGEGIFQGAGIPHAYLEGINVELMANSDNVLRGGLTLKHIDVPELLANIHTDTVIPQVLRGSLATDGGRYFELAVPEFALAHWQVAAGKSCVVPALGPAIGLVLNGTLALPSGVGYRKGEAFFLPPDLGLKAVASGLDHLDLFVAYVPAVDGSLPA